MTIFLNFPSVIFASKRAHCPKNGKNAFMLQTALRRQDGSLCGATADNLFLKFTRIGRRYDPPQEGCRRIEQAPHGRRKWKVRGKAKGGNLIAGSRWQETN